MRESGMSNREIADKLSITQSSARRLISEAREARELRTVSSTATQSSGTTWTFNDTGDAWWNAKASNDPPRKYIIIPDTQCKPDESLDHLLWAGRYIAEQEPHTVVHLGDHWDLPSLSSYEKPGSRYFEGKRLLADLEAGNAGMELLALGMGGFAPKRQVLLRGNHEDRLTRMLNDEPKFEGIFGEHSFVSPGWEVVPYLQPIELDGILFAHYFYNPNTGRPYAGNVETMIRNVGQSFIQGHQQGLRMARHPLPGGRTQRGLVAGSYYTHAEPYRGPQATNEWRGLVVLHEVHEGDYNLMEVSIGYLEGRFG